MILEPSKLAIYVALYASYTLVYFCKRLNYAELVRHGTVSVLDVGLFGSAAELCGGVARLVGGVFVDSYSPSLILSGSLVTLALANLLFFVPPTVGGKVALWGVNGFALALAWPALTRIFMAWFPDPSERGTWYSLLSTSMNAGAAMAPHVLAFVAATWGWQASMLVPGGVLLVFALVQYVTVLRDAPPPPPRAAAERAAGLGVLSALLSSSPSGSHDDGSIRDCSSSSSNVAATKPPRRRVLRRSMTPGRAVVSHTKPIKHTASTASRTAGPRTTTAASDTATPATTTAPASTAIAALPPRTAASVAPRLSRIVSAVLTSRAQWLLGTSYLLNTVVRQGLVDWASVFLDTAAPGGAVAASSSGASSSIAVAATCVTAYEVGGAAGGFLAGIISDRVFAGRRGPVMTLASVLLIPFPIVLAVVVAGTAAEPSAAASLSLVADVCEQGPLALLLPSAACGVALRWLHALTCALQRPGVSLPLLYAVAGMLSSAPHVLNGLASREYAEPWAQSSAGGFTKALGQVGGALAGAPLGRFAASRGWGITMALLSTCAALSALVSMPLWNRTTGDTRGGGGGDDDGSAGTAATAGSALARRRWALRVVPVCGDDAALAVVEVLSPNGGGGAGGSGRDGAGVDGHAGAGGGDGVAAAASAAAASAAAPVLKNGGVVARRGRGQRLQVAPATLLLDTVMVDSHPRTTDGVLHRRRRRQSVT